MAPVPRARSLGPAARHRAGDGRGARRRRRHRSAAGRDALLRERRLGALALDELRRAQPVPLGVDLPNDKRLRALCEAVLDDPTRHGTLDGWARDAGASPRTVARLVRSELGTSFAQWRQRVLLAKAVTLAAR